MKNTFAVPRILALTSDLGALLGEMGQPGSVRLARARNIVTSIREWALGNAAPDSPLGSAAKIARASEKGYRAAGRGDAARRAGDAARALEDLDALDGGRLAEHTAQKLRELSEALDFLVERHRELYRASAHRGRFASRAVSDCLVLGPIGEADHLRIVQEFERRALAPTLYELYVEAERAETRGCAVYSRLQQDLDDAKAAYIASKGGPT